MSNESPAPVSRTRLLVLIAGPVLAACASAFISLFAIGWVAMMSAIGHGSLTRQEAIPYYIAGTLFTLGGTAGVVFFLERQTFGERVGRTAEVRRLLRRTRGAALSLMIAIAVLGPPLVREITFQRQLTKMQRGDPRERYRVIYDFAMQPSDRAFPTLRAIAADTSDVPWVRSGAVHALWRDPEAKPLLVAFAADEEPFVRAAAGTTLLRLSEDEAIWKLVVSLVRDDPDASVREPLTDALARSPVPALRSQQRVALLAEIATGSHPVTALMAARALGPAGYDAILAIVMHVRQPFDIRRRALVAFGEIKDDRAIPLLQNIVSGEFARGFIDPEEEDEYRRVAIETLGKFPSAASHWRTAYSNEQMAESAIRGVVEAQLNYRAATGRFAAQLACLERPVTCDAGRNRDETFLPTPLVSLLPHGGYQRLFEPAAAVPREPITATSSPSSVTGFVYVTVPEKPGLTGLRGFCGDDTGRLCFTRDGLAPVIVHSRCPESAGTPWVAGQRSGLASPRECQAAR